MPPTTETGCQRTLKIPYTASMVCDAQTIWHCFPYFFMFAITYIIAMDNNLPFSHPRKSEMTLDDVYFWNDTIKDWRNLLKPDKYKLIIIETLKELVQKDLVTVYGFV
ncbi:MAG: hypothetical protein ACK4ND_09360, partial [Cytophagaceae bacterium]